MPSLRRTSANTRKTYQSQHRFEHWLRDNQVYFITARVRGRFPAFDTPQASSIFWNVFDRRTAEHGFTPWVTSLVVNHYHTLGYLKQGDQLPKMMKLIHGAVSKQINDLIEARAQQDPHYRTRVLNITNPRRADFSPRARIRPFWIDSNHHNYFDGCLRNRRQAEKTFRYIEYQCRRHGICHHPADYPDTRVHIDKPRALARADELQAYLYNVPYKRYQRLGKKD